MFKIQPIQSEAEQASVAKACGSYMREGLFAYAMRDSESEELMGFSQFEISEGRGYITDIKPCGNADDFEAMFILGRATMNFIDTCGAHLSYATKDAGEEGLMRALGFSLTDSEEYYADMRGMFNGECHEKK